MHERARIHRSIDANGTGIWWGVLAISTYRYGVGEVWDVVEECRHHPACRNHGNDEENDDDGIPIQEHRIAGEQEREKKKLE